MPASDFKLLGTYEDLIRLVMRLEERILAREHRTLPGKPRWQRLLLEYPLNLLGAAAAGIFRLMGSGLSAAVHLRLYDVLTSNKYHVIGINKAKEFNNLDIIYRHLRKSDAESPILCLTSHPPVAGEIRDLNLGLMSTSYRLMRNVRGNSRRFRILLAVDSMALDTLTVPEEGFYAGVMGLYDIGVDRYPSSRSWAQRLLFRHISYERAALRLAESLRRGENVIMVQSGGVGTTARILYTIREFIWALRRISKESPARVSAALAASEPDFRRFREAFGGDLGHWRAFEAFFVAYLANDSVIGEVSRETFSPCETGSLQPRHQATLAKLVAAFGLPGEQAASLLAGFEREFARITPYRLRLFEFLLRRVVQRHTGIVIQPIDHSMDPRDPILVRAPIGLTWRDSRFTAVTVQGSQLQSSPIPDSSYFKSWGESVFAH